MNQKNQFFLLLLLSVGFFLTSCQKEKAIKNEPISRKEANKLLEEQRQRDMNRIHHFVDKMAAVMDNDITAREEPLTIEELTFGTEAVLNIYFTNPENRFKTKDESISDVVVPITNGRVDDADLLVAYTEVSQKMVDHLDAATYPDKKLVYVDVVLKNTTATEATLEVRTAVGDRNLTTILSPPYFTKGWRCGEPVTNDAGKLQVGDIDYNEPGKDAAKLFTFTLNEHFRLDNPLVENPGSCLYSYGVTASTAPYLLVGEFPKVNPNDPAGSADSFDNSKDYLFYKISKNANNSDNNYESKKYLDVDEMNFYYSGLEATILGTEDPVWQMNNSGYFPEHVPLDSESWFVGWTFLSSSIFPLEMNPNSGLAQTIHVPKIIYQQTIGTMCIPTGGDPEDAILALSDWP